MQPYKRTKRALLGRRSFARTLVGKKQVLHADAQSSIYGQPFPSFSAMSTLTRHPTQPRATGLKASHRRSAWSFSLLRGAMSVYGWWLASANSSLSFSQGFSWAKNRFFTQSVKAPLMVSHPQPCCAEHRLSPTLCLASSCDVCCSSIYCCKPAPREGVYK